MASQPGVSPPQRSAKPSEKPRLRQIPSAEDLETDGGGPGQVVDDGLEHRELSHGQPEARGPAPLQQHPQVWQSPPAPQKVSSEDSGAWCKVGKGERYDISARGSSRTHGCPIRSWVLDPHQGVGTHTHTCTLTHPYTHIHTTVCQSQVKQVPFPAGSLAFPGATHTPALACLPLSRKVAG